MYKLTGFAAVARAADAAARQKGPDPRDPRDPCPELEREVQELMDDEITIHYGIGSDIAPLVVRLHQAAHGCSRFTN